MVMNAMTDVAHKPAKRIESFGPMGLDFVLLLAGRQVSRGDRDTWELRFPDQVHYDSAFLVPETYSVNIQRLFDIAVCTAANLPDLLRAYTLAIHLDDWPRTLYVERDSAGLFHLGFLAPVEAKFDAQVFYARAEEEVA